MPIDKNKNTEDANAKKITDMKLKAEIKEAEDKKRKKALEKVAPSRLEEMRMSYDSWYALRSDQIPKHHKKEVIWADMKSRGTALEAPCTAFDEALSKYGIKLK